MLIREHRHAQQGDINDNWAFIDILELIGKTSKQIPLVEYYNEIVTLYKTNDDEYYVYATEIIDDYDNVDAYIQKFSNRTGAIEYLLNITDLERYTIEKLID